MFVCKATEHVRRKHQPKEWREKVRDAGPEALARLIVQTPGKPPLVEEHVLVGFVGAGLLFLMGGVIYVLSNRS